MSVAIASAVNPPRTDLGHIELGHIELGNIELGNVDLGNVRDTLLYIESDVAHAPDLERLAAAIRDALTEIEKLEAKFGTKSRVAPAAVHFLPAGL